MRREVMVLMGAATLAAVLMIGLCGEVAAQTVRPGVSGVDLTGVRGQNGLSGAMPCKHIHGSGEWEIGVGWAEKGSSLQLTMGVYALPWMEPIKGCPVQLRVTYYDTFTQPWIERDSSYFSGVTNGDGCVKFTIKNAQVGTYVEWIGASWYELR